MADQFDVNFEEILPDGKLPGDLMVSILLKLPVKSLLKFKSVCKPWCSLIASPNFIKMHLHRKSISARDSILLSTMKRGVEHYALLTDNCKNHASVSPPFPSENGDAILTFDTCNGLVCLGRSRYNKLMGVILWNPATRKYWSLDLTSDPFCPPFQCAGLGYVEVTNDYKVVGVTGRFPNTFRSDIFVYALSSNSCKNLDYDCSDIEFEYAPPVTVSGRMHWMTRTTRGSQNLVAAFDVADEIVSRSMVPDNYGSVSKITRKLVAIRGSLAILVFHRLEVKDIEVWIMTEYGVQGSWAKRFTLDAMPNVLQPPSLWKDEELLFTCDDGGYLNLVFYDLIRKTKKYYTSFRSSFCFRVFPYIESFATFEGPQRSNHSIS